VLVTVLGGMIGYDFVDKEIGLNRKKIFSSGIDFYRMIYCSFRSLGKQRVVDIENNQKNFLK